MDSRSTVPAADGSETLCATIGTTVGETELAAYGTKAEESKSLLAVEDSTRRLAKRAQAEKTKSEMRAEEEEMLFRGGVNKSYISSIGEKDVARWFREITQRL
jgi:uncharacterized metal-binding protein